MTVLYVKEYVMEINEFGDKGAQVVLIQPVGDHESDLIENLPRVFQSNQ